MFSLLSHWWCKKYMLSTIAFVLCVRNDPSTLICDAPTKVSSEGCRGPLVHSKLFSNQNRCLLYVCLTINTWSLALCFIPSWFHQSNVHSSQVMLANFISFYYFHSQLTFLFLANNSHLTWLHESLSHLIFFNCSFFCAWKYIIAHYAYMHEEPWSKDIMFPRWR